jgi:cytochrome c oxidase assembly factor CtaG
VSPTLDACLRSWPFDPRLLAALLLTAGVYLRGWLALRRRDPRRWPGGRPAAFLGGLAAIELALASPVEPFAGLLLQVHMVQHLLLMMMAPPLLWLGAPLFPLLRGLPRPVRMVWVAPWLSAPPLRRLFQRLTHPLTALVLFVAVTWVWHAPPVYDLALRSNGWHYLQHACFLGTALVFWYPIVRPYPARPRWSPWLLFPCLILADLSNTALAALLTFSNRLLYPYYAQVPRLAGLSPLDDQSAAGVVMWVPGSAAFLLPLFGIGVQLLSGPGASVRSRRPKVGSRASGAGGRGARPLPGRISLPVVNPPQSSDLQAGTSGFDLLRLPLLGRFLKWRHARLCLQVPLLLLAVVMIDDGLRGPQVGALNLAGVLPWIHGRGLLILGLLAAGNVFCMGCPFLLPRTLARRFLPAGRSWPRRLRSKWFAILLIVAFLWAYEALALWDRPKWTAYLALGYFAAAFVVDGLFRGASFCKYVCPIGQFNFVQSLASPMEVKARDPAVCASCRTRDCIRGRDGIPGCELGLFQPKKLGNLDCTFCLDCVHSCPHENVGILPVVPGRVLVTTTDRSRSGLGRLSRRPDLAALIVVVVFGGLANAAGMVEPVLRAEDRLQEWLGLRSPLLVISLFTFGALIALPVLLLASATMLCRHWGRLAAPWPEVAARYTYALVPLGLGIWTAHLSFHLITSYGAIIPTAQRFADDLGWSVLGIPDWNRACCLSVPEWLLRLEITFLDLGLLLSLYTAHRLSQVLAPRRSLKALAPWAMLIVGLFAVGVWIVLQPMQMRGTLAGGG